MLLDAMIQQLQIHHSLRGNNATSSSKCQSPMARGTSKVLVLYHFWNEESFLLWPAS